MENSMTHHREIHEVLALDRASVRVYDDNGNLHVKYSPLTRVQVAPYLGKEIPGWQGLGLEPQKIYYGYRPPEELKRPETVASVNGIPIQLEHHPDYPDDPARETRIGSTGDQGRFLNPFLVNSLHFQDQRAIDHIKDGSMRELSLAYRYEPDFTSGTTPGGENYDFVMRNISANHLALVEEGRAGRKVLVYDSAGGARMDTEKTEMQIAEQMGSLADKLKNLHTEEGGAVKDRDEGGKPDAPAPGKTDTEAPAKDGGNPKIDRIIAGMIEAGVPEEKARSFTGALEELAGGASDGDDELPPEEKDADSAPAEDEEPEEKPDAEDEQEQMITDAMKACGLDADEPGVREAFKKGMAHELDREPDAQDGDDGKCAEDDGEELAEGADLPADPGTEPLEDDDGEDLPPDGDTVDMGQDSARLVRAVERRFKERYTASREVEPFLGRIDPLAYDSAAAIYRAALKEMGVTLRRGESARDKFAGFKSAIRQNARLQMAQDAAREKAGHAPDRLETILNRVKKGY